MNIHIALMQCCSLIHLRLEQGFNMTIKIIEIFLLMSFRSFTKIGLVLFNTLVFVKSPFAWRLFPIFSLMLLKF